MKRLTTFLVAAVMGLAGCGRALQHRSDGLHEVIEHLIAPDEDRLRCPAAREPVPAKKEDHYSQKIYAKQLELYDNEQAYFIECAESVRLRDMTPARPTYLDTLQTEIDALKDAQNEWKKHDADAEVAHAHGKEMDRDKVLALQNGGEKVSVHNEHTINNSADNGGGEGGLAAKLNRMFGTSVENAGLTIQEQEQICNGTYKGSAEVVKLGEVAFEDCVCRPLDPSSRGGAEIVASIEANLDPRGTLLYCGSATEPSAKRCKDLPPDYGNGELSWDRAERTAMYTCHVLGDKVNGTSMAAYANKTKEDSRKTDVYIIRKVET